jgi:hypothetical protein
MYYSTRNSLIRRSLELKKHGNRGGGGLQKRKEKGD